VLLPAAILLVVAPASFSGTASTRHEVANIVHREYRHSIHSSTTSGVQAIFPDCHVPKASTTKIIRKIKTRRGLYCWLPGKVDTREKFGIKRLELVTRVWETMQKSDSRECRNWHLFPVLELCRQVAKYSVTEHACTTSRVMQRSSAS